MSEKKRVILCVDDDADLLEAVKLRLEHAGYKINTALTAEEGLRSFKAEKPDFIIVDLMMEEIDSGVALVKDLSLAGNKAPIFMLSSTGDQLNQAVDYQGLGLDGVFQKPVNFEVLLKTLKVRLG
jgi:DNA-binding response OmpR family regulator